MKTHLWHGTNQTFERFDPEMLGLNTSNNASRAAFFFAATPETAEDYARQAARKLVPGHQEHEAKVADLLAAADRALAAGQHDAYEARILEAEELECRVMQAEPAGAKILRCEVTFSNPFEIDGCDYAVIRDLGSVLEDARDAGFDAVILRDISDTPSGEIPADDHVAVFDASQIEILEVHPLPDTPAQETPEEETLEMSF
jgi:hypothetical protein